MTTVLGFDTSGAYCAAALFRAGTVVSAHHEEMAKGQAERLLPLLEATLAEAGANWSDLDALAVGVGPGNFTGIRISVSAARGLAMGLGVPAIGVSLLECLAFSQDGPVLACLDARRGWHYLQRFGASLARGPSLVRPEDLTAWHVEGMTCIGTSAAAVAERLDLNTAPATYAPASAVVQIGAARTRLPHPRPAPLYLRAPDAAPSSAVAPVLLP